MDNISIILQKLSTIPDYLILLKQNKKLMTTLKELSLQTSTCFGGGGDESMESPQGGVSDFLLLNIHFILKKMSKE
jgi:hypothetical protein